MLKTPESGQSYHWTEEFWIESQGQPADTWRALALGKVLLDEFFQSPQCDWPTLCARLRAAGLEPASTATLQMLTGGCLIRMKSHDDIPTLLILCQCLRQLGRTQLALQAAELKLPSDHPELLTCYATLLCDSGRWSEAHQYIERALNIQPSHAARQVRYRILAHAAATGKR